MNPTNRPTDPTLTLEQRETLLDLVRVDERIALLSARLDALPEDARVERLEAEVTRHHREALSTRRIAHDMAGTLHRLRADAARLRARRQENVAALHAVTDPGRRHDLRHDLETAERRLAEIEDDIAREERTLAVFGHSLNQVSVELDAEARNAAEEAAGDAVGDAGRSPIDELTTTLDRARREAAEVAGEIRRQIGALSGESVDLRTALPPDVLARYEAGEREHGIGAAELAGATCRCCCIELDTATLRRFANTAPDRLVSCPECGVLLIRPTTEE